MCSKCRAGLELGMRPQGRSLLRSVSDFETDCLLLGQTVHERATFKKEGCPEVGMSSKAKFWNSEKSDDHFGIVCLNLRQTEDKDSRQQKF